MFTLIMQKESETTFLNLGDNFSVKGNEIETEKAGIGKDYIVTIKDGTNAVVINGVGIEVYKFNDNGE